MPLLTMRLVAELSDSLSLVQSGAQQTHATDTAVLVRIEQRMQYIFSTPQRLDTSTIALEIYDIDTRRTIYSRHATRLAPPASCMKLLTAVAAMQYLGIDYRFQSQVRAYGTREGGTLHGDLVILLSDDPLTDNLEPLAQAVRRRGISKVDGQVQLHLLRTDTLRAHATASVWDIPFNKLPITLRGSDPILSELKAAMRRQGVTVTGQWTCTSDLKTWHRVQREPQYDSPDAPARYALLWHRETPLTDVLAPMLIFSSNIKADALFQHMERLSATIPLVDASDGRWLQPIMYQALQSDVATTSQDDDTFSSATHILSDYVVNDGSGLSPTNRLTAHFLVKLLEYAWHDEPMRRVLINQALATPAHPTRHGSLLTRMSAPLFVNKVFVKTGTLTTRGLSSLAGYVQASDGRWLIFAVINENSPVGDSRVFQDYLCREMMR